MTIQEIKDEKLRKTDQLLTDCKLFFAFTNEQFEKNKTPLTDGDKYVSIGGGGYMPKSLVQVFINGQKLIEREYKAAVKAHKQRKENILYELRNHEAFYTNDLDDTLEALGSDYSRAEVLAVFETNKVH